MPASQTFSLDNFIREHLDSDSGVVPLPTYNILKYTEDRYKIVYFPFGVPLHGFRTDIDRSSKGNDKKLSQAISRARKVVLELALCNDWKWFATLTIAKDNFDRKNLEGWYSRFHEWLKGQRKVSGKKIPYLLVPEQHGDGSWHMHGFFNSDIDEFLVSFSDMDKQGYRSPDGHRLPRKLINNNYFNWPKYQSKFGFCSFGEIKNKTACSFYAAKYISKSFQSGCDRVGLRLYYPSAGLNRSEYIDSVYGHSDLLHSCLTDKFEWCSTGFFVFDHQPGDDPVLDLIDEQKSYLYPIDLLDQDEQSADDYYNFTQLALEVFR